MTLKIIQDAIIKGQDGIVPIKNLKQQTLSQIILIGYGTTKKD